MLPVWTAADEAPRHLSHSTYYHENVEVGVEANYFYPTAMALSHPMAAYVILIIFGVDFNHFRRCDLHLQKYHTYCIYGIYMWEEKVSVEVTVITLLRKICLINLKKFSFPERSYGLYSFYTSVCVCVRACEHFLE